MSEEMKKGKEKKEKLEKNKLFIFLEIVIHNLH
jgi:hypothetical protein